MKKIILTLAIVILSIHAFAMDPGVIVPTLDEDQREDVVLFYEMARLMKETAEKTKKFDGDFIAGFEYCQDPTSATKSEALGIVQNVILNLDRIIPAQEKINEKLDHPGFIGGLGLMFKFRYSERDLLRVNTFRYLDEIYASIEQDNYENCVTLVGEFVKQLDYEIAKPQMAQVKD